MSDVVRIKQAFKIAGTLEGTKFIVEFVLNNNVALRH